MYGVNKAGSHKDNRVSIAELGEPSLLLTASRCESCTPHTGRKPLDDASPPSVHIQKADRLEEVLCNSMHPAVVKKVMWFGFPLSSPANVGM